MRGISIKGKRYKYLVLKVLERDAQGRPHKVDILYDEEVTTIEGGEHFWIVLAPVDMHRRNTNIN